MSDPFELRRFLAAQDPVLPQVLAELQAGVKRSHWMWFVFPQLRGLGRSQMAQLYGIGSRAEAVAYLEHPILGPRLCDCTALATNARARSAHALFGSPDDLKFRSSMTLFAHTAADASLFRAALAHFFNNQPDEATLALLGDPN